MVVLFTVPFIVLVFSFDSCSSLSSSSFSCSYNFSLSSPYNSPLKIQLLQFALYSSFLTVFCCSKTQSFKVQTLSSSDLSLLRTAYKLNANLSLSIAHRASQGKGLNGKINNRQSSSSRKRKKKNSFWQRFCTFNESMQSQSTTANEVVPDSSELPSSRNNTDARRCPTPSLRQTAASQKCLPESGREEPEDRPLRAHALPEEEEEDARRRQENKLTGNQIEVRILADYL